MPESDAGLRFGPSHGFADEGGGVADLQLLFEMGAVGFHGLDAEVEATGDFARAEALADDDDLGAEGAADSADDEDEDDEIPVSPARRAIIPAGQPLPPQPSANEISPEALAKVSEVEKSARRLTLMELTEKTCKWPVGDPATDNFWFCGLPVQPGTPYCEAHVGVAFQPMSARRDRRR